jgi:UDP-N-acetylmuramoyl-L-alanyl-D-glutamate--2,6-diaminopimelate ligase
MKNLSEILKDVKSILKIVNFSERKIKNIAINLNEIKGDDIYFIIKGRNYDGMINFNKAYDYGVRVFVSDRDLEILDGITLILVKDSKDALFEISKNFYDDPSKKMNVFGVTGSSGKTSVVSLLKKIFPFSSSISSQGVFILDEKVFEPETTLTTPESHHINRYLKEALDKGTKNFFIETSSFALKGKRVFGISFKGGIFLNFSITHHLMIHGTILDYLNSKLLLKQLINGPFLVNLDNPYSNFFKKDESCFYFSYKGMADFYIFDYEIKNDFHIFSINLIDKKVKIKLRDYFDIYPVLPSISLAYLFNLNLEEVIQTIENTNLKPNGRWEVLFEEPLVVVDKSNTPLSIHYLIEKINKIPLKKRIVLFSFFEEEDLRETYVISKILSKNFDYIIITQDDTTHKSPFQCNLNFIKFLKKLNSKFFFIKDRREAIKFALSLAKERDGVFILGRGDEKNMKIKRNLTIPFNDVEVTKDLIDSIYLKRRGIYVRY